MQIRKMRWIYLNDENPNEKWSLGKIIEYTSDYNTNINIVKILLMAVGETLDLYNDGATLMKRVR